MPAQNEKLGLIAGNGKFPFLVLDAARAQGFEVVVAALKEEAFPEISEHGAASIHWLSLGELSKLIETFQREGVRRRPKRRYASAFFTRSAVIGVSRKRTPVSAAKIPTTRSGDRCSRKSATSSLPSASPGKAR